MIVISDMMGTLTTGSPFLGMVDWVRHNQSKMRANLYMASIAPSYLLAKHGLLRPLELGGLEQDRAEHQVRLVANRESRAVAGRKPPGLVQLLDGLTPTL